MSPIMERYFVDVPVYRLSEDRYDSEMDASIDEYFHSDALTRSYFEKNPERKDAMEGRLRTTYGGGWQFNEIIGYIRLHFFDRQIAGEYYVVNAERIVRTRRKTFVYETDKELAEVIDIPDDSSSREIYMLIHEYLGDCAKEVKGRYVDTTIFDRIGPFVDWKALLEA